MLNENRPDPREGLRYAYLIVNPLHNDQDYEDWLAKNEPDDGELGHHEVFAAMCESAMLSEAQIERFQERAICFARGYHTAMGYIALALAYVTNQIGERYGLDHNEEQLPHKKEPPEA